MNSFFNPDNCFLYIAILWSLIFGFWSVFGKIFGDFKNQAPDWKFHQILFNGLGGFVGWIALWYLWNIDIQKWEIQHLVALGIAFLGISGYLPYVSSQGKIPGL